MSGLNKSLSTFGCWQASQVLVIILLLSIEIPSRVLALDPNRAVTQYVHDIWQSREGLPQNSVNAIAQTADGYIWLGTQEGLARFDGVQFTVYNTDNTAAFRHNYISSLLADPDGSLWIGTQGGGLVHHQSGVFTTYTTDEGLHSNLVLSLWKDPAGRLWIGADDRGLCCYHNGIFSVWNASNGLYDNRVMAIRTDRHGKLWIGNGSGLCRITLSEDLRKISIEKITEWKDVSNGCIFEDSRGNIWIGANELRWWDSELKAIKLYSVKNGLSSNFVNAITEDRTGTLWIGTKYGVNRWVKPNPNHPQFESFTPRHGLSNEIVMSLMEDREGSLWIGTDGGGLNRFRDSRFITYSAREGLSHDIVVPIIETKSGEIWLGTDNGVSRIREGTIDYFNNRHGLSDNFVRSLCADRRGNIWIGTEGGGLNRLRFTGGKPVFTLFSRNNFLRSNVVLCIIEDRTGRIWVGTESGGLSRLTFDKENITVKHFTTRNGLTRDIIRVLYEDRSGNIWIGTDGGGLNGWLANTNDSIVHYSERDGLSNNVVISLLEDKDGIVWIGTDGGGLNRLDLKTPSPQIKSVTTRDGLYSDLIYQILEDDAANLWMTCNKGIFKVSREALHRRINGGADRIRCETFHTPDGLRSNECNGGSHPAGMRGSDGRLWFPTLGGAAVTDPRQTVFNPLEPPVFIESFMADNRAMAFTADSVIPAGTEKFEFHYTALSYRIPERVKFRYRLEGFDNTWTDAETRRTAYYTHIAPGWYTFRVIACNDEGVWNATGASFRFYVEPRFYQTLWFYLFCAILIIASGTGIGAGIHRFRVRQLKQRESELKKLVDARTQDLERQKSELQDALTRLKNAEIQLVNAEKMASLGRLSAGMAHEINNPIGFILNNIQPLRQHIENLKRIIEELETSLPDNSRHIAEKIKHHSDYDFILRDTEDILRSNLTGSRRIIEIVNNLKHFARLDEAEWQSADINECLRNTLELFITQKSSDIEIQPEFTPLPSILCYAAQLNQVFMNLLTNAADAIEERKKSDPSFRGVIAVKTEILCAEDTRIRISIRDNGPGINPEITNQIFEPFFTTKPVGRGTGLGLSICYSIVERHKGRLYFESEPGKGTKFIIEIPVT